MDPFRVHETNLNTHGTTHTHSTFLTTLLVTALLLGLALFRLYAILPRAPSRTSRRTQPCHLAVFLGSGGHTSEAITLISSLDFSRYYQRTYIISQGDILSAKKASALELSKASEGPSHPSQGLDPKTPFSLLTIPRARRVHQTLLTTPVTALRSLAVCLYYVTLAPVLSGDDFADVLILNGPGTCCMLCAAVYVNRFLGLRSPKVIYVESFARVRTLSLSGKLLRPFVDKFIVQWPDILRDGGRGEYRGWLV